VDVCLVDSGVAAEVFKFRSESAVIVRSHKIAIVSQGKDSKVALQRASPLCDIIQVGLNREQGQGKAMKVVYGVRSIR
jgi:hypothetical protein